MNFRAILVPLMLVLAWMMILQAQPGVRERSFSFRYAAVVKDIPAGARQVDLWIPVPHDDPSQKITALRVETAYPHEISKGQDGNNILHLRVNNPDESSLSVTMQFEATRREHLQSVIPGSSGGVKDPPASEMARYLAPDRLVPLDEKIREWAREVVEAAHAETDLEKARAIYNHVVSTVKYDKSGKGWGRGDIYYACEARRGNCTDFHAIFIGYCRALGIPARFAIGFPLPAQRGAGKIAGYHCWAEFYAKGIGWVPVDASEAAKDPARRQYFFGAHDENRVEFSRGRDLDLVPPQRERPLNYFIYPYAEVDGKIHSAIENNFSYRDMTGSSVSANAR